MAILTEQTEPTEVSTSGSKRIALLDLARGIAVAAMAIYHFSWDLSWFAIVDWRVADDTGWRAFAISIAASFVFLAGFSLDLAHHRQIRWRPFWKREGVILAAAACVSLGTYFAFSANFVRFGILHSIAISSLIALPFTQLPLVFSAVTGLLVLALPHFASSAAFGGDLWLWTGLGSPDSASVDYVPLAPWTGAALLGVAVSQLVRKTMILETVSRFHFNGRAGTVLRLMGRHSLLIYLVHQPVLYGLVWSATFVGPDMDRTSRGFQKNCAAACIQSLETEKLCEAACACTLTGLKKQNIWEPLLAAPQDTGLQTQMNQLYGQCLADPAIFDK